MVIGRSRGPYPWPRKDDFYVLGTTPIYRALDRKPSLLKVVVVATVVVAAQKKKKRKKNSISKNNSNSGGGSSSGTTSNEMCGIGTSREK